MYLSDYFGHLRVDGLNVSLRGGGPFEAAATLSRLYDELRLSHRPSRGQSTCGQWTFSLTQSQEEGALLYGVVINGV